MKENGGRRAVALTPVHPSGCASTDSDGGLDTLRLSARQSFSYVVISPVRDEEGYVERTLRSMLSQTIKPAEWIIVDDGSTDDTREIIARYAADQTFIKLLESAPREGRQPGARVVSAFNRGYKAVRTGDYSFVVKLDCDLSFAPDYFERLLREFISDQKLGIASGVYLEQSGLNSWKQVKMPSYHAAGASKVIRRECFEDIGGFVPSRGWDTVDEIRAMAKGWRTAHFPDLEMKHWKQEGTGIGVLRTSMMHGEIHYLTGGGWLFFALKVIKRAADRPILINGLALLWGYLKAIFERAPRLVTHREARCYRQILNSRVLARLRPNKGVTSLR